MASHKHDADLIQTLGIESGGSRHRRWLWLVLLLTVTVVSVLVIKPFSADSNGGFSYQTAKVERGDLTITVTATGTLSPLNQVEVGSELSGTVASIEVDYNDRVSAGQVLARLDTTALENRIAEGKASLQVAHARLQETEATELESRLAQRRCQELAKRQMCSNTDLDSTSATHARALAAMASAKAQVALAQAVLEGYQTNLKKALIRSPINGMVLDRKVEPGQTVAASLQTPVLFTLAEDLTRMELLVAIDEADIGQIKQGLSASFTVDAYPERSFEARVTQIRHAPQTVEGVVTYQTVLSLDNSDLALLPGMTATAEIVVNAIADTVLIPNAALRFSPPLQQERSRSGGSVMGQLFRYRPPSSGHRPQEDLAGNPGKRRVWTLREGVPVAVAVTVGATDGQLTELLEGDLEPGMALLVDTVAQGRR